MGQDRDWECREWVEMGLGRPGMGQDWECQGWVRIENNGKWFGIRIENSGKWFGMGLGMLGMVWDGFGNTGNGLG